MLRFLPLLLASASLALSQVPSWLAPKPPPAAPPVHPAAAAEPKTVVKIVERVVSDTVYVPRADTVVRVDTLRPPPPLYFSYSVYYEIVDREIALQGGFEWAWQRTAQKTELQSSDTTLLSLGKESLREASFTYDGNGNRTSTYEKLIEGLDMRVSGSDVSVTYRIDSSLLTLRGRLDRSGLLQLSSDFSRRRYFLGFVPLDFLFSSGKYTLFLRVEKAEAR